MSMQWSTFRVAGMSCEGCANTVSAALRELDVVTGVEIDLAATGPATVRVQADRPLTAADVAEALADDEEFSVLGAG